MKIFQNFKSEWQIKDNLQDAKVKISLFISEINIYLNSWSKFLLNNRQPFKALKGGKNATFHPTPSCPSVPFPLGLKRTETTVMKATENSELSFQRPLKP